MENIRRMVQDNEKHMKHLHVVFKDDEGENAPASEPQDRVYKPHTKALILHRKIKAIKDKALNDPRVQEVFKAASEEMEVMLKREHPDADTLNYLKRIFRKEHPLSEGEKIQFAVDQVLERHEVQFNKESQSKKQEKRITLEGLPDGIKWEDIEIRFQNAFDAEILLKDKLFKRSNNEEMGFFRSGTKDRKLDAQWKFLQSLAVLIANKNRVTPTIELMAKSLQVKREACLQTKSKTAKKLQSLFGIEEDPFESYNDDEGYKTKFKLTPETVLRGSGNIFSVGASYKEGMGYEDPEEDIMQS